MKNKRLIVVLGMHRSGTSAITRGLKVLGADFGTNLQAAMPGVNDKGFFEDNDVVSINVDILLMLSHEWHTLSPIATSQLRSDALVDLRLKAIKLLRGKLQSTNVLAIKDPRVARLLPFWKDVFSELGIDVSYVIVIRNPLSVAESLNVRDHIEKEKSSYLWLEHVLPSILETSGTRRVVVDYDNIMERPLFEIARIAEALGFNGEIQLDELTKYEKEFLDVDLRHVKFDINELISDSAVPQSVVRVYRTLVDVAADKWTLDDVEVLNCVQQAAMHIREFAPALRYMTRQGWKIAEINQAIAERNEHIVGLNEALAERNEQITNLNRAGVECGGQIANLQLRESELRMLSSELRNEIEDIRLSTSWRITKPLRDVSRMVRWFMRLIQLYRDYRKIYPGVSGAGRLVSRCINMVRKAGIKGLRSGIAMHEQSRSTLLLPHLGSVLMLDDIKEKNFKLPKDVAVHIHIYYSDLASEIRAYLANIPIKFHCYVTTDTPEKVKNIEAVFSGMKNIRALDIRLVENKGRDIAPMIVALGAELARHEVVLHIHTKRSPHNLELRGWRRYMMMSLLGDTQRVATILHQFVKNERLGILSPKIYRPVIPFMRIGGNAHYMEGLLRRSGNDSGDVGRINPADFPAGAMFWFRGRAIQPLVEMGLTLQDFDAENSQCDATLAHAIERLFPYFANANGLIHQSYLPTQHLSSQSGAVPLTILNEYCIQGIINSPVIVFDHNIGGGANRYSRNLLNEIISDGNSVLRIYYENKSWIIEWVEADDGLIFAASSEEEMFGTLAMVGSKSIVVNSIYGYADVDDIVTRIVGLARLLNANLDYKVHDFYAICPSQHLLDLNERYCGVPNNHNSCNVCLKKNLAAHWASSRPVDIDEWRHSFARLFDATNIINVFDRSTIEILREGFQLEDNKFKITPHGDDYFEPSNYVPLFGKMHIGILGTLTTVKGAAVVNALAEYFDNQGIGISISIVGKSLIKTVPRIKVLGHYENNSLPEILRREGINTILMPSIVPETFSYAISEAIKMKLPIVAFDIGAQGHRVKLYELGKVIPLDSSSEVIFSAIDSSFKMAKK